MTRTGKIARLPRAVRDELNRRLREGETGVGLVAWLNHRPEVRQVLDAEFGGRAINEQNLSEWKTGGYAEWQSRQEMLEDAREMAAEAVELAEATAGRLTDHLATVLAARFASVLTKWNGVVTEEIRGQLKLLHGMCGDVAELRRGDHGAFRLEQEQERLEQAREKTEAEVFDMFDRWAKMPPVRDLLCKDWVDPDERGRQMRASFGLPPLGETVEGQKQKFEKQKAEMSGPEEAMGVLGEEAGAGTNKGRSRNGRRKAGRKPMNQGKSNQINAERRKQVCGKKPRAGIQESEAGGQSGENENPDSLESNLKEGPADASTAKPDPESDRPNGSDGNNGTHMSSSPGAEVRSRADASQVKVADTNGEKTGAEPQNQGESDQIKPLEEGLGREQAEREEEELSSGNFLVSMTPQFIVSAMSESNSPEPADRHDLMP